MQSAKEKITLNHQSSETKPALNFAYKKNICFYKIDPEDMSQCVMTHMPPDSLHSLSSGISGLVHFRDVSVTFFCASHIFGPGRTRGANYSDTDDFFSCHVLRIKLILIIIIHNL